MTEQNYIEADVEAVSDNPELTEDEILRARPFVDAFPHLAAKMRGRGRQKAPTKVSTTIRLSPEVIAHFRAGGPGWQVRIDEALKDWVARHR